MAADVFELERTFTQHDFDAFAALSGDDNPIHVDPSYARTTRFGRTVAHGMLLNSVFRGVFSRHYPDASLLSQDLMFPAPSYVDERLRFAVTVSTDDSDLLTATMTCSRTADDTLTCSGIARFKPGSRKP